MLCQLGSRRQPRQQLTKHQSASLTSGRSSPDGWQQLRRWRRRRRRLICLSGAPSLSASPAPTSARRSQREQQKLPRVKLQRTRWTGGIVVHLFGAAAIMILFASSAPFKHRVRGGGGGGTGAGAADSSPLILLAARAEAAEVDAAGAGGKSASQVQEPLQLSLFVDTKYWIRNMEFDEQVNWRSRLKPCTLIERIAIQEQASVVSLGDALGVDGLEANIRELILAQDGVLLLEEDTLSTDSVDPLFIQYLNESGNCFDSTLASQKHELPGSGQPVFVFQPDSDSMSWFNPDNWYSEFNDQINHLVPDSHKIPCSEDVVVFGSKTHSFWSVVQGNEQSKLVTFKVNFRPAEGLEGSLRAINVPPLRVSKLKIAERSYSQAEFDKLNSIYGNNLFDFDDEKSVFNETLRSQGRQDVLLIDESSIQLENSMETCHEEAGCYCGNEQTDVMKIICSFNYPVDRANLPCRDPIQVTGYCDKICATSLVIIMDPNKFKEGHLTNEFMKIGESMLTGDELNEQVFIGSRRVDHNRYEIVLRLMTGDDNIYERSLGLEIEFAKRIKQHLEIAATKSFYGIRSIKIRSSVDWRRDNQSGILLVLSVVSSSIFVLMFVENDEIFSIRHLTRAADLMRQHICGPSSTTINSEYTQSAALNAALLNDLNQLDMDMSASELSLAGPQPADLALVEMDTQSVTDSTRDLIDSDD